MFHRKEFNCFPTAGPASAALAALDLGALFEQQRIAAPRRGDIARYLVGHTGITTSGLETNRREEHLAIALWIRYRSLGWLMPDGTRLYPIDYQLPLKSHRDQANAGVGKVDLFALSDTGQPSVIELKVHPAHGRRTETPLKALLEGLAYSAILDANREALCAECRLASHAVKPSRPQVIVLAPAEYWAICANYEARFPWRRQLTALRRRIEETIGIQTRFVSIEACRWSPPAAGLSATLAGNPLFRWAPHDE